MRQVMRTGLDPGDRANFVTLVARLPTTINTTRQRDDWNGPPVELGDAWTLRKGDKVARGVLVTHRWDGASADADDE